MSILAQVLHISRAHGLSEHDHPHDLPPLQEEEAATYEAGLRHMGVSLASTTELRWLRQVATQASIAEPALRVVLTGGATTTDERRAWTALDDLWAALRGAPQ